jgi:CRP-like cAMP-binding protein
MVGKLWYLKKFDLFSRLDHEAVEKMAEKTTMDTVDAHQKIYLPGDAADTIFILKKGRVKISRINSDGKRITLALLEPGELFGELALTGEDERSTMAEAVENSLICSATTEDFTNFLSEHPELNFEINRVIGERRRKIESKIENLIFKDASERLAYVLKDLFENHPSEGSTDNLSVISLSHDEIADLCGLTRPTATKLLNQFQDDGVIQLNRRKIKLEDPHRLRSKVN